MRRNYSRMVYKFCWEKKISTFCGLLSTPTCITLIKVGYEHEQQILFWHSKENLPTYSAGT